jgi:hydroxypyruvate isomerase
MAASLAMIPQVQLADNPGCNKSVTGRINAPGLFDQPDRMGHSGWIGCECSPKTATVEGLCCLNAALQRLIQAAA